MLDKLLTGEFINLNIECSTWKEAIMEGAKPLLEKEFIDKKYIDAIFQNFEEIGPYMVIAPRIVLSHARPENGVKKLAMSMITLKTPIKFGNELNDPVKLVVTLAASDNDTHLQALIDLMDLFTDIKDMKVIFSSDNKKEVIEIIKRHSNINSA